MTKFFDPLDYENLGASIARALDEQPVLPLEDLEPFDGVGIYALYYSGDFPCYEILSNENQQEPGSWAIYIGKAEAENARKGDPEQANKPLGPKLYKRILDHRNSIVDAENLNVHDFQVRALTVAPTWVPLAEVVAIRMHKPAWNVIVAGLGNHNPGAGRKAGTRPRWDTLHPGRSWAVQLRDRVETVNDIEQAVVQYLETHCERFRH
ncbi:Eco29kI family restriction endonuclease [Brevibacterium luteolum]|uniref:Eco29kI family restriction endonuclease n=1 Tax=Brevibacterium luteolum TaxID=199591 RepID=UPI00223B9C75|nr:Eco29kI family restriction endonuclease [Brevibacterium luteolum]MCT1657145.1 Eco29kI family restriction endonuclease [Brevibacterium luteolum]MCT1828672.1 Eco29kI family restriction endonuclease [Brevibacterium luteolum]